MRPLPALQHVVETSCVMAARKAARDTPSLSASSRSDIKRSPPLRPSLLMYHKIPSWARSLGGIPELETDTPPAFRSSADAHGKPTDTRG